MMITRERKGFWIIDTFSAITTIRRKRNLCWSVKIHDGGSRYFVDEEVGNFEEAMDRFYRWYSKGH